MVCMLGTCSYIPLHTSAITIVKSNSQHVIAVRSNIIMHDVVVVVTT